MHFVEEVALVIAARLRTAAFGVACALGTGTIGQAQPVAPIAIRNARIVPVSGAPIDGGSIVLVNGLIKSVGSNVDVPAEAVVIDGTGLTVYPGLIDALTDLGMAQPTAAPLPAQRPVAAPTRLVRRPASVVPRIDRARRPGCRPPTSSGPTIAGLRRGATAA